MEGMKKSPDEKEETEEGGKGRIIAGKKYQYGGRGKNTVAPLAGKPV